MSENTQLDANYMRCNKEELDKLEEFDKSVYGGLSEFTDNSLRVRFLDF